jgi:hypothetical protein
MKQCSRFGSVMCLLVAFVSSQAFSESFNLTTIKVAADEYGHLELVDRTSSEADNSHELSVTSYPQFIVEHQPIGKSQIIEVKSTDAKAIDQWLRKLNVSTKSYARLMSDESSIDKDNDKDIDEVRTLVSSGSPANRIDLVFMGDGYTIAEREKFFSDMQRLVNDMFVGQTFTSYLPMFNVHAVFRPSNRSGIGRGSAADTAYRLFREGETLRAIFPGNKAAIRQSCAKAPGCDYPVVIANDPYYGGLGGEFAISTSSPTSGTVVLRHELGHNFGRVGEEYDGGGYFGANHSSSLRVSWPQWASTTPVKAEPLIARFLAWPWHRLDQGPFSINFTSDGNQDVAAIRFSASGIETDDTLGIALDGDSLDFQSPNRLDRTFVDIDLPAFGKGSHTLSFSENISDQDNWLSNLTVHEYGPGYHHDNSFVGAYPVFNPNLSVAGYRPTNEGCLMRDMMHPFFCPVCQENNWLHFFDNVRLIDQLKVDTSKDSYFASLSPIALGQFRTGGTGPAGERLAIKWFLNGVEDPNLRDQTQWNRSTLTILKTVRVDIEYVTSEVRKKVISDTKTVKI